MTIPFFITQEDLERLNLEPGAMAEDKSWLLIPFPHGKRKLAQLSSDQKMEWYAYQFQQDPQRASIVLSTPEFQRFWKWRVLIPMKLKRFYYRLKNGELFKRYEHITDMKKNMKKKMKKHSI